MSDLATRSYWLGRAPAPVATPFDGSRSVDLAVVGGGLVGLWSALLLKEADPALEVAVVEAKAVGYGATGRGTGVATWRPRRGLAGLLRRLGPERARVESRAREASLRGLRDFADAEGIRASVTRPGLLVVSTGPEQDARLDAELRAADVLGVDALRPLDRRACALRLRCEKVRRGLWDPDGLLLDPAAFARGLAEAAQRRGVRLYEQTPVDAVETISLQRVELRTPTGTIRADRAVVATGAYAAAFRPLRSRVCARYVHAIVTEPLGDDRWRRLGWERRMGVADARELRLVFRPTPDGRLLCSGGEAALAPAGPNPRLDRDPARAARLEAALRWHLPQLGDLPVASAWGAPAALAAAGGPSAHWLPGERVLVALAEGGDELATARLVGEVVRDLMLGDASERTGLAWAGRRPKPLPPLRLRGPLVGGLERMLARADEERRAPGPLAALLRGVLE